MSNICPAAEGWEIIRELSYLDVDAEVLYRPFRTLSNGEQTKVLLAALFLNEGNFLLIDEPTNHLDTKARQTAADYLKRKKGFILVSHDRAFLDGCVDHILAVNKKILRFRTVISRAGLKTLKGSRNLKREKMNTLKGILINYSNRHAEQLYGQINLKAKKSGSTRQRKKKVSLGVHMRVKSRKR